MKMKAGLLPCKSSDKRLKFYRRKGNEGNGNSEIEVR